MTFQSVSVNFFCPTKFSLSEIALGSFFRAAVPDDVVNGSPTPSSWGAPVAVLEPADCNPLTNFVNHSIIFGETTTAFSC